MWHCITTLCVNKEERDRDRGEREGKEGERDNASPDSHLDIHDCRLIKFSQ